MLTQFFHEEVIYHLQKLHVSRKSFTEKVGVPIHGQLLDRSLRLEGKAPLCDHECLLEGQTVVVDQQAQQLKNADGVLDIKKIELHLVW